MASASVCEGTDEAAVTRKHVEPFGADLGEHLERIAAGAHPKVGVYCTEDLLSVGMPAPAQITRKVPEGPQRLREHGLDYDQKCFISQSACMEDAKAVAAMVEEKFPKLNGKVMINSVGTVVGSHTGPGTVALFFWGDSRKKS